MQNIYYMLSYAFQVLQEQGYKNIETEKFNNILELYAEILVKGITIQLKRGLGQEYISCTESLSTLQGRVNINQSIKTQSMLKKQLVCNYDDFSVNSYLNRIIKTTMLMLIRSDITKVRKKSLRRLLVYFNNVDLLDEYHINWKVQYNRNNQTYRMLVSICNLVISGLLQTNAVGSTRVMDYMDEKKLHRLYEKFILEYYRREFPKLNASAAQIPWQLDDDMNLMLPVMQTDIMLKDKGTTLIIDAKFYQNQMTQEHHGKNTQHSSNLYQIFTYVKNMEQKFKETPNVVSGLLLYARTDESILPDMIYHMSGNKVSVRSLDLNRHFSDISKDLNKIVNDHFS